MVILFALLCLLGWFVIGAFLVAAYRKAKVAQDPEMFWKPVFILGWIGICIGLFSYLNK